MYSAAGLRSAGERAEKLLGALDGEEGPVKDLILYNAALQLWMVEDTVVLEEHLENARYVLDAGLVERFLHGRFPPPAELREDRPGP